MIYRNAARKLDKGLFSGNSDQSVESYTVIYARNFSDLLFRNQRKLGRHHSITNSNLFRIIHVLVQEIFVMNYGRQNAGYEWTLHVVTDLKESHAFSLKKTLRQ